MRAGRRIRSAGRPLCGGDPKQLTRTRPSFRERAFSTASRKHQPLCGRAARTLFLALLAWGALFFAGPSPGEAQLAQILEALSKGETWVNLPVKEGRGLWTTPSVPAFGLRFEGCARIWEKHSGTWKITATDLVGGEEVRLEGGPGAERRFSYEGGAVAKLQVQVEWSEPRDTTLFLWIGLKTAVKQESDADPCAKQQAPAQRSQLPGPRPGNPPMLGRVLSR